MNGKKAGPRGGLPNETRASLERACSSTKRVVAGRDSLFAAGIGVGEHHAQRACQGLLAGLGPRRELRKRRRPDCALVECGAAEPRDCRRSWRPAPGSSVSLCGRRIKIGAARETREPDGNVHSTHAGIRRRLEFKSEAPAAGSGLGPGQSSRPNHPFCSG